MKRYIVLYETEDTTSGTWECESKSLLGCIDQFQEKFGKGSWDLVINWTCHEITEPFSFPPSVIIAVAILISSCGYVHKKLEGENHRIVGGNQQLIDLRARNKARQDSTRKKLDELAKYTTSGDSVYIGLSTGSTVPVIK